MSKSNIFLKNVQKKGGNVSEFLDTENVSSASLPQWLSVVDVPQKGGNDDNLTDTAELEAKLKEIFNAADQEGGAKKKKAKKSSKKSSKKSKKETELKKKASSSKKEVVKKTKENKISKKKPEIKSVSKKKILSKNKNSEEFSESDSSNSESETESMVSESVVSDQEDYENTETKMSEFFSDEADSQTMDETDMTEFKTETSDTIDPKETIYNNLVSSQKVCKQCPTDKSKTLEMKVVEKSKRLTNPRMTKYEMVRIIGERTKQFKMGAKPLIKNTDDLTYEEKALLELKKNMTPIKIKRPLPNNTMEIWEISELKKDHLEF